MNYEQWMQKHPAAAADMAVMIGAVNWAPDKKSEGKSETWAQQTARINITRQGAYSWRNNVGATKTKCTCGAKLCCPRCGKLPGFYRWGLANDSATLNEKIKSSDLILGIPRIITPDMLYKKILQFGTAETKKPGWEFNKKDKREVGQAAWMTIIREAGGYATFTTGELNL